MASLFLALLAAAAAGLPGLREETFSLDARAEVVASLSAGCAGCSWGVDGREAAVLVIEVDGSYSQHVVLTRGPAPVEYPILLGPLEAGQHQLRVRPDPRLSAPGAGAVVIPAIVIRAFSAGSGSQALALALAPFLYARPGALESWSDQPLVAWYETDPLEGGGQRLRYSVVFTNEDGGTPPDRLMACWGRTTDIEFVYSVELDGSGRVAKETIQGRGHELVPFTGQHLGRHPLLYVVTDNNMVGASGVTTVRFAPAPRPMDLASRTREAVMDDTPWTYRVSSEELRREGKVAAGALAGSERVPDPRRFVFLEACAPETDATLAFSVGVEARGGGLTWYASDRGGTRFRVRREAHNFPNGCFQAATPLPEGVDESQIRAIRIRAYTRPAAESEPALPPGTGRARLLRVNRLFMLLEETDEPGPSLLSWSGDVALVGEGEGYEIPVGSGE
jgi:hypothetical protein